MFTPPARKSMSDQELQAALGAASADESGILGAMELLEAQSTLREQDNREFAEWERNLTEIGTPEALHAIENGRRLIAGLEPIDFVSEPIDGETQGEERLSTEAASGQPEAPASEKPYSPDSFEDHPSNLDDEIAAALNALYSATPPAEEVHNQVQPTESHTQGATDAISIESSQDDIVDHPQPDFANSIEPIGQQPEPQTLEIPDSPEISDTPDNSTVQDFAEYTSSLPESAFESSMGSVTGPSSEDSIVEKSANSQLWPWLALTGSGLSLLVGFAVSQITSNASDAFLAIATGLLLANLPIIAGVVAGKRSGLSAVFVSRSAFGVIGAQIPGWLILALRIASIAGAAAVLINTFSNRDAANSSTSISPTSLGLLALALAISTTLALKTQWLRKSQIWISGLGVASIAVFIASMAPKFSFNNLNFEAMDASKIIGAASFVFALFVGFLAPSAADYSRELSKRATGAQIAGFTLIGSLIAPIALSLVSYIVFAGGTAEFLASLGAGFGFAIAAVSPVAFTALVAAAVFGSVAWFSGGLVSLKLAISDQSLKFNAAGTVAFSVIVSLGLAAAIVITEPSADLSPLLNSYLSVLAIPTVAWAGIFSADVLLRRVAYHEVSLSRAYGFYKAFNFTNLFAWLAAVVVGFGFFAPSEVESSALQSFTGFFADLAPEFAEFASSGWLLFLIFGFTFAIPLATGVPRVKIQEREALSLEARRDDLKDIFKFGD